MSWQVTMTLLWCDKANSWVTVFVYKNGNVKCGHLMRLEQAKKKKGKQSLSCDPFSCVVCASYKEKVFTREAKALGP